MFASSCMQITNLYKNRIRQNSMLKIYTLFLLFRLYYLHILNMIIIYLIINYTLRPENNHSKSLSLPKAKVKQKWIVNMYRISELWLNFCTAVIYMYVCVCVCVCMYVCVYTHTHTHTHVATEQLKNLSFNVPLLYKS